MLSLLVSSLIFCVAGHSTEYKILSPGFRDRDTDTGEVKRTVAGGGEVGTEGRPEQRSSRVPDIGETVRGETVEGEAAAGETVRGEGVGDETVGDETVESEAVGGEG
jgi:GETHR pentapeptide repeat (5 copies).